MIDLMLILFLFVLPLHALAGYCWYLTRKIEKEVKELRKEIEDIKREYKAIRSRVDKLEEFVKEKELEEGYKALREIMEATAEGTFSAQREVVPDY